MSRSDGLGHEAYELRKLESEYATRETIPALELGRRINARQNGGLPDNLHEQAWDEANRLIERMRKGGDNG